MTIKLPQLVTSVSQSQNNIIQFNAELLNPASQNLVSLLSSFISWYAIEGPDGGIIAAPSKFIGYSNMTAALYTQINRKTNGRDTEVILSRWYQQPSPDEEQRLLAELSSFLSPFGKTINKRARISTIGGRSITNFIETERQPSGVIDAMVLLYQSLGETEKNDFLRRIAA